MLPNWNLNDLYNATDDVKITTDLKQATNLASQLEKKYNDKINGLTAKELYKVIVEYEKISEILGKISTYAYLYFVTDMTNPEKATFYQNISEKINDISQYLLFLPLEIAQIDDEILAKLYQQSQELANYKPYINDLRVSKKYQKSKEIEKILHEKDQTANSSWSRLFDETIAGLTFKFEKQSLTATEIFDLLSSHNAEHRKKAAKSVGRTLKSNIKLLAFITNILAKDKAIDDKIRKYPHPVKARNVSNFIEDEVVNALISTVENNYENLAHRYYKIKAGFFGKKALDYWDRNSPLPGQKEQKISWGEAKEIILDSYHKFSPQIAKIVEKFFINNWIDAQPKPGKDSGAFAHPATPGTHPYIMVNFQGKLRDVMTLAHELGHGAHQYLARKQGYLMSDTPLTLAETASIFGEQLTFESLLSNCKNNDEKRYLLASKIEDSLNTIVRQIAFYSFELEVHTRRKGSELTVEELCDIWLRIQKKSLGPAIKFHSEYKYFWSYIPHFIHSPFYVYAYAFGNCLVNSLYSNYKAGLAGFEQKYIKALEAGGTLHHKELLKPFSLDAGDQNFWQQGLTIPIEYINKLEHL